MEKLRLGIVGSGMIADIIANAVKKVDTVEVVAVTSRRIEKAQEFAKEHNINNVFMSWEEMIESDLVDAIYIATPTSVKEEIALFGAKNKKHLLVDKPFDSLGSLTNIINSANENGVAFMDATHFTNNPRTVEIKNNLDEEIGIVQVVRTSFFFPFMDRENIRFNEEKEPLGSVGDMAWYNLRAVAEYLQTNSPIKTISGGIIRDEQTNAIIRGTGVVVYEDGKSSTFDFGYNAGVCVMDLDILGHKGMISLDDYVLDWNSGFAFNNPNHNIGYTIREGMAEPKEFEYVSVNSEKPQASYMIENFASLTKKPQSKEAQYRIDLALKTQELLDLYWNAVK